MSNHKQLLQIIIANYGFRCHGDQRYNHSTLFTTECVLKMKHKLLN